jgi:hypothetical protein
MPLKTAFCSTGTVWCAQKGTRYRRLSMFSTSPRRSSRQQTRCPRVRKSFSPGLNRPAKIGFGLRVWVRKIHNHPRVTVPSCSRLHLPPPDLTMGTKPGFIPDEASPDWTRTLPAGPPHADRRRSSREMAAHGTREPRLRSSPSPDVPEARAGEGAKHAPGRGRAGPTRLATRRPSPFASSAPPREPNPGFVSRTVPASASRGC